MKNKLTLLIILAMLIFCLLAFTCCGEAPQNTDTSINTGGLLDAPTDCIIEEADGFDFDTDTKKIYKTVTNDIESVDLSNSFKVTEGASWKLYKDYLGEEEYKLKSMLLSVGENKAYIVVYHPNGEDFTRYELVLYRLDIKDYSFVSENQTVQSGTIEEFSSIEAPATNLQKTGYNFDGWTVDGEIVSFPYQVSVGTVFEAKFTPIEYKITYDNYVSENPGTFTVEDLPVSLIAPEFGKNQTFAGWYATSDFFDEPIMQITQIGNVNLYAKIVDSTDGLVFTDNGDTCSVTDYTGTSANVVIPIVVMGKKVTTIGKYAFRNCTSLESVTIPNSVTSIGSSAFYNCDSLTSVNISDIASWCNISFFDNYSNPLYYANNLYINGELITELVIPNTVTEIKSDAFRNCTSLTSITIPDSVTLIGSSTFQNCALLTSVTLPDGVTTIGSYTFSNCSSLTSIIIPSSVTKIGIYTFSDCTRLTEINFNAIAMNDLHSDNYVFSNAGKDGVGIKVTIGKDVTKIPDRLFYPSSSSTLYSPKIINVVFENGGICESIGYDAFQDCSSLTSVNYLGTIEQWCNITFDNEYSNPIYYTENLYLNGVLVTDLVIPNTVAEIKKFAFYNCDSITSVTIPNSVTSIGSDAFSKCSSLEFNKYNNSYYLGNDANPYLVLIKVKDRSITSCTINENTKIIYNNAFDSCDSLTSIIIPDSVISIGIYAFNSCDSLRSIIIPDSVTSIRYRAFIYCSSLRIYCEASSKPYGWDSEWNYSNRPVVWGHTHSYTDGACVCGIKEN